MRLGNRRAGTSIAFVDAPTGEVILRVALDEGGRPSVYFRLYDSSGSLAAESEGLQCFPTGLDVRSGDGELLLGIPDEPGAHLQYCLYNRDGALLTTSDGSRTQIKGLLRMEQRP